jgi:hypothetical protein
MELIFLKINPHGTQDGYGGEVLLWSKPHSLITEKGGGLLSANKLTTHQ